MLRILLLLLTLLVGACDNRIYLRDGVTDGDTFYLADRAFSDTDPVLQGWVAYSLARSACQLDLGGENPARNSSYGCEYSARALMLDTWEEKKAVDDSAQDAYLDGLLTVREAGLLDEYVVHYFGRREWMVPAEVDLETFSRWRRQHLRGHRPETRLIGSWNFADMTH